MLKYIFNFFKLSKNINSENKSNSHCSLGCLEICKRPEDCKMIYSLKESIEYGYKDDEPVFLNSEFNNKNERYKNFNSGG